MADNQIESQAENIPDPNKMDSTLKLKLIIENRKAKKKRAEEARKEIEKIFNVSLKEGTIPINTAIVKGTFMEVIDATEKEWEQLIGKFEKMSDFDKKIIEISNESAPLAKKIDDISKFAKAYLVNITKTNKADAEAIAKMLYSQHVNVSKLQDLLIKKENEKLIPAARYALGMGTEVGRAIGIGKEEAFKTLKEVFGDQSSELQSVAWMILGFMKTKDREEFTLDFLKNLSAEEKLKFLEKGNLLGVFSPIEMKRILPKQYDPKKEKAYAQRFKVQNDFKETALKMSKLPYGSENILNKWLTGKNIIFFLAQIASVATIGGNLLANIFKGGRLHLKGLPGLIKNRNVLVASAVLGFINLAKKEESVSEFLEGKGDRERKTTIKESNNLYVGINSHPNWKKFFEKQDEKETHLGASVFWEYITTKVEKDKLNEKKITIGDFYFWLKKRKDEADSEKKGKYEGLFKMFCGSKEGEKYCINNVPVKDEEIKLFAKAFFALKIGGKQTKEQYEKAIDVAEST